MCHGLRKGALNILYRSREGLWLTAWQHSLHRPQSSVSISRHCSAQLSYYWVQRAVSVPERQEADKIQLWHTEVPAGRMLSCKMPGYPKSSPEDLSLLNTGVWISITLSWDLLSAAQPNTKEQWELSWITFCAWGPQWLHLLCLQRELTDALHMQRPTPPQHSRETGHKEVMCTDRSYVIHSLTWGRMLLLIILIEN